MRSKSLISLPFAALAGVLAVAFLWWLDAYNGPEVAVPRRLAQGVVALTLGLTVAWLVRWWRRETRSEGHERRRSAWVLVGLVGLALVVRWTGIGHEAAGRYYLDEGTYFKHATDINGGQFFSASFVYPHLLYYAGALVLWVGELLPDGPLDALVRASTGVADPLTVSWWLLRMLVGTASALVVIPVFWLARRLGGLVAGGLAGLLAITSTTANEMGHLIVSDVPAGVFAAVTCAIAAALAERESHRGYLLAGVAAGLAAGSKYPAGVVAVAIVAVWLAERWRTRRWSWGLGLAGLAAVLTLIATTPSFLLYPAQALTGDRGIFFGVRQYGAGGWIGVLPRSNVEFYGREVLGDLGVLGVALGAMGLGLALWRPRPDAAPGQRRQLALALVFPLAYFGLIAAMNMVVRRNLLPLLPLLAVLAGVGVVELLELGRRLAPRLGERGRWALPLTVALCLALPARDVTLQALSFARPSTRDQAAAWITEHVPAGATIVKESYTPEVDGTRYRVIKARFAGRLTLAELSAPEVQLVVLADAAYARFLNPEATVREHQVEFGARYREILATFREVAVFAPSSTRRGPTVRLLAPPGR